MNLNKTLAVALHRAMWTDMQSELGNNPSFEHRAAFKEAWIKEHFPEEECVMHNCFLCDYAFRTCHSCSACPIVWPEGRCTGYNFSYESAPICDILALPEKGKNCADFSDDCKKYVAHDEKAVAYSYYQYREELLSKASGIPAICAIDDHVKKIREKAVEEYFAKTPGAKLATIDVDQAFKQYADEVTAPIFHALAKASGLSADNESVNAHISKIRAYANQLGRINTRINIFETLSVYSGVSKNVWNVHYHAQAIEKKASNEKFIKSLRTTAMQLADKVDEYKDKLSNESDLDRNRPVDEHIKKIVEDSFDDGRECERERIMDKIGEMLNDKPTRTAKDS